MSCVYCENKVSLDNDGEGEFIITRGNERAFVEYELLGSIFDTDIRIYDDFVIKYCPMCGEKL